MHAGRTNDSEVASVLATPSARNRGASRFRADGSELKWRVARGLRHVRLPSKRLWLLALILIAPAVVFRAVTSVYPFVETAWLSLTNASAYSASPTFVGIVNYTNALADPVTRNALIFTIVFALASTALEVVFGFALALLLNAEFKLRALIRSLVLLPWAIPAIVSALGFRFMFSDGTGVIPHVLSFFGVHIEWLSDPTAAQAAVILANVWRNVPFIAFIILAGLQGVPKELYEAARMDGAGWWRTTLQIVMPLVMPLLITMGIFMVIFQLGTFDTVLGMTGGGPGSATQVAPYLAYQQAFTGLQYGRASATAMLLFFVVLIVGALALAAFRRSEVEQ